LKAGSWQRVPGREAALVSKRARLLEHWLELPLATGLSSPCCSLALLDAGATRLVELLPNRPSRPAGSWPLGGVSGWFAVEKNSFSVFGQFGQTIPMAELYARKMSMVMEWDKCVSELSQESLCFTSMIHGWDRGILV